MNDLTAAQALATASEAAFSLVKQGIADDVCDGKQRHAKYYPFGVDVTEKTAKRLREAGFFVRITGQREAYHWEVQW